MHLRCALVGMPGSGKSTVGRQLANRLHVPFVDLDQRLEKTLGCTIRQFFENEGEERFRDIESRVLSEVVAEPGGMVLSTGGGAVLRPANRELLRQFGHVMYLRASPEDIFRRIRHDRTRPLLQVDNPLQRIEELYVQRDPLYREIADITMDSGNCSVAALARRIEEELNSKCAP